MRLRAESGWWKLATAPGVQSRSRSFSADDCVRIPSLSQVLSNALVADQSAQGETNPVKALGRDLSGKRHSVQADLLVFSVYHAFCLLLYVFPRFSALVSVLLQIQ
jgi:hypothetical protein